MCVRGREGTECYVFVVVMSRLNWVGCYSINGFKRAGSSNSRCSCLDMFSFVSPVAVH